MPIKPITGIARRSFITDLTAALTLAFSGGGYFWWGYHLPAVKARDQWYRDHATVKDA